MKRNFENLTQQQFDMIIVGGGIVGTGIARDASLRGLKTLLVEKEDFSSGTTSRSTRLIHGGLRYLRMLEFKLVWQDLHEREILLRIAPHLVSRLPFVIPLLRSKPFYRMALPLGLCLYDILASGKSLPSRQYLPLKKTLEAEPALADTSGLTGSFLFYDCQAQNMERLCLENALGADAKGARILNYTEATDFLIEGGAVKGVCLRDRVSGKNYTASGTIVINAAGPWADLVWNKLKMVRQQSLRRTKGIHLVTRSLTRHALVLFAKSDGRLFFIIPWNGCSLIGTTDTDYSDYPDNVSADKSDVDYLIAETRNYFPHFGPDCIYYTMAGLRPLVASGGKSESNTSRSHKLIDHESKDGIKGLISILGGKITAYRAIAEETVDLAGRKLGITVPCRTSLVPLPGSPSLNQSEISEIARENGCTEQTIGNLADTYGSRLVDVLKCAERDRRLANKIAPGYPNLLAEVQHAVLEEEALTVSDFMLRRSLLGLRPDRGCDAVPAVTQQMAQLLGWSSLEEQKQIQDYQNSIDLSQRWRLTSRGHSDN